MNAIASALGAVLVAATSGPTVAQTNKPKTVEEYQAISDRALAQAMERAAQEKARQATAPVTAPLLQPEQLRKTTPVDPAEIAARYEDFKAVALPPADDLLIFVSTSMPMDTLTRLANQAKQADGVLVFRGMKGDLRKRREFAAWIKYLEPVIKTGASIQINPLVFKRYDIKVAPSFVIASREEGCNTDQCKVASTTIEGDVSLDYALEHWVQQGGRLAGIAQARLAKMPQGNR